MLEQQRQRHAGAERPQAAGLDRRPIGHRIGERHADLDDVGTRRRQALEDRLKHARLRIAAADEGDEAGAAFVAQRLEAPVETRSAHRPQP